jgi:hypothetical protein
MIRFASQTAGPVVAPTRTAATPPAVVSGAGPAPAGDSLLLPLAEDTPVTAKVGKARAPRKQKAAPATEVASLELDLTA